MPEPTPLDPRAPDLAVIQRSGWRASVAREYNSVATRLTDAYGRTVGRLAPFANDLTRDLLATAPDRLNADALRQLDSYQTLLVRVNAELQDFAGAARDLTSSGSDAAVTAGVGQARRLAIAVAQGQTDALGALVSSGWVSPAPEAIARLISYADGEALRAKFARFGESAAQTIADMLITGIAQGMNPNAVADMMQAFIQGMPLHWAQTTARTTILYSYRAANHASYLANADILEGWRWSSSKDSRTCPSCWGQDGKIFPLDRVLNDHHNGRCAPVPVVRGARWIRDLPDGAAVFNRLGADQQRAIMGAGAFALFKAGRVTLKDFSTAYTSNVYGDMLRAATLRELRGQR